MAVILLVEDDPAIHDALAPYLRHEGWWRLYVAERGDPALRCKW
jgi:DNA-binding response OmpR family regulator